MTTDLVLVDDPRPRVRRLTLNRPDKRNALSNELRTQLFQLLRAGDLDPDVHVIVIRGAGPCFSAGYDISAGAFEQPLPRHASDADGQWPRHIVDGWLEVWDYATPVIGQVHGYCIAGGTELAAACDLVYVADDARIGYPPVRTMTPPDMAWQPWLLGMRRAMESLLTGDAMTGAESVAAGFANRSLPTGELEQFVLDQAERIALIPPALSALNKRTVHRAMDAMGIRAGLRAHTELWSVAVHQAASQAFGRELERNLNDALDLRDQPFGDYRTATEK
jgi:enoyl-CoA hydratase